MLCYFTLRMKRIICLILCIWVLSDGIAQHITGLTIAHDGETRVYDLYIPVDYTPQERVPLIFNMHGFSATSESQAAYTGFNQIADTARFIIVYPQGLTRTIDTGQTGTHWNAYFGTDVDDKGFLIKLMDKVINDYTIDESRIYATGWSNGGYMSYRMACEASERFAAVASVTGTMVFQQLPNCNPTNPVSVLHIHGTEDQTVNYNGSSRSVGVPEVITRWVENNSCVVEGVFEENIPDIDPNDNSTVTKFEYNNCSLNTDVHLYKVDGGGHTWPGATLLRPELGATNQDIKASSIIWNFFRTHRNSNFVTSSENDESQQIFVYPAVFTNEVDVNRVPAGAMISMYSYSGRLLFQEVANEQKERFDTHSLKPGIYIIHVQLPGKEYASFRLVKNQ